MTPIAFLCKHTLQIESSFWDVAAAESYRKLSANTNCKINGYNGEKVVKQQQVHGS